MNATSDSAAAFVELTESLHAAIETYSNVHRGSGHFSIVTTRLFEQARDRVLEFLGVRRQGHAVIFCGPRRADVIKAHLGPAVLHCLSSQDIGLPLGVRALVVRRSDLPSGAPFETGGGTARLVARNWVVWAKVPDKFEPGTPGIVNVIAFGKALQLMKHHGIGCFEHSAIGQVTATDVLHDDALEQFSGLELLERLRRTHIGNDVLVPTRAGTQAFINLDNGASTPTFEPIWQAFCKTLRQPLHVQKDIVEEVKSICAGALGAPSTSYDVIFTANTTEAINLVARSLGNESVEDVEPVVLNTLLEHNSNELPWRTIAGYSLIRLPVDAEGFVDMQELEGLLQSYNQAGAHGKKRIRLVAVSGASNVLGTFNDLAEIGKLAHQYGARLLVDAAQLVAHRQVEMERCGIDYLAFSAHKMYAPFGSGALVARKGALCFAPQELELIQASGAENAAGIAAMGKAFLLLQRIGMDVILDEEQSLTAYALERLSRVQGIRIFGVPGAASARFDQRGGVIALMLGKAMPAELAKKLSENAGIGVRYGCHCSHLLVKRLHNIPPFLERVQWLIVTLFPKVELPGVLRVSLGIENTREHVDRLVATLEAIASKSKGESPADSTRSLSRSDFRKQMDAFVRASVQKVYA